MINKYDNYLQELHNRNYSIYDDSKTEEAALQELHDNSYMIFDEEETLNLMIKYEEEFNRLSHEISFISLLEMKGRNNIFEFKLYPIDKEKKEVLVEDSEEKKEHDRTLSVESNHRKNEKVVKQKGKNSLGKGKESPQLKKKSTNLPLKKNPLMEVNDIIAAKQHFFYIQREFDVNDICDASGHYDPVSNSFILHKDSVLSLDVTSELRYSALDIQRRFFIKKHCIKKTRGYRLLHEIACLSPSQAAFFVLGCKVDGWVEWEDRNGKTLDKIYKKPI